MTRAWLDARPIIVAVAGPNGAGKSTFYESFLATSGLRFLNADDIARERGNDAYAAAGLADALRRQLVASRESFAFETVFSDPVGEKVAFLEEAAAAGFSVVVCFIGISTAEISDQRVAMRVSQGGHDVDTAKLLARFPRTMANLGRAIARLPHVLVYDNDNLSSPYRLIAEFESGRRVSPLRKPPPWLKAALP